MKHPLQTSLPEWKYIPHTNGAVILTNVFPITHSMPKKSALEYEYLQLQIEALKNRFAIFLCISITYFVKSVNGVKARPKAACRQQQLAYKVFFPAKKQRKLGRKYRLGLPIIVQPKVHCLSQLTESLTYDVFFMIIMQMNREGLPFSRQERVGRQHK